MKIGRFKKNSISVRLMMYFIGIVLLPIIILSLIMQSTYKKSIIEMAKNHAEESLDLINYNLDQQFKNYESLAYFISRDRQLQEISQLSGIYDYNKRSQEKNKLYRLLNYYRSSVDQVSRVVISYENGILFTTEGEDVQSYNQSKMEWYKLCKKNPDSSFILNYKADEAIYDGVEPINLEIITVCHGIRNVDGEYIGAVSVEMFSQVLEKSMSNILSRKGSYVYVLNGEGMVVYSPVVGVIPESSNNKNYCKVEVLNQRNQWKIIGVVPLGTYIHQIDTLTSILVIALLIITVTMAVIAFRMGISIVRPIETLRMLMKEAEKGNLTVYFQSKGPEEIQDLGESFNIMIEKLDHNIKQVYIEQKAKRKAEMEVLQANIKPHFLYNTLDTIHWMAKSYHATDIVETVDALSTLFRISLSKGKEIITVEQEIQHVTSYLQIQKVRYEEMISYEIHVAENCKRLMVQKLILQPLIENSIYHGIKESGYVGKISIFVWREKADIFLAVEDDGMGMSRERLKEVCAALDNIRPDESGAYGVVNVHQRLILNYGAPYGLYLESEENVGTTALIMHPVL